MLPCDLGIDFKVTKFGKKLDCSGVHIYMKFEDAGSNRRREIREDRFNCRQAGCGRGRPPAGQNHKSVLSSKMTKIEFHKIKIKTTQGDRTRPGDSNQPQHVALTSIFLRQLRPKWRSPGDLYNIGEWRSGLCIIFIRLKNKPHHVVDLGETINYRCSTWLWDDSFPGKVQK